MTHRNSGTLIHKMAKRVLGALLAAVLALSAALPAQAVETGFSDVSSSAPYAEAVAWCRERRLMLGVSSSRFAPDDTLTRAMVATVLYRAEHSPAVSGGPAFLDTKPGAWYADAVIWVDVNRVMKGYGSGRFGTDDPVTREQLATILWRHGGQQLAPEAQLVDRDKVSDYARGAVDWAVEKGMLLLRADGGFHPKDNATRAEIAVAFYAYLAPLETVSDEKKILVTYYSATGSTRAVAEEIARQVGGDIFEIVPADPYTSADLNWNSSASRVSAEHDDPILRLMELKTATVDGWEDYDVVFIGYPIWWGIAAWPVDAFIKANDFTGKIVIPFCTSASSGPGQSAQLLAELAGSGDWRGCYRFPGGASSGQITDWLNSLSF